MLSEKGEKIAKMKYYKNGEDWSGMCWRVAYHVASAEKPEEKEEWAARFYQIIYNKLFIPAGRILSNAGTKIKNLNNCFTLPIHDSRESIYQTLKDAAEIFAWGGGVGYNFSELREEGAPIITTGGKASGPLSFMSLFDQTGEVISQASRRGAQIGLLNIDHPDIENFINYKSTLNSRNKRLIQEYLRNIGKAGLNRNGTKYFKILEKTLQDDQLSHFNISVVLNDRFMNSVINNGKWDLISRFDGRVVRTVDAKYLLDLIGRMCWESGDPGVIFYDAANEDNMTPYIGDIKTCNPCGEVLMLDGEPCCLGSLNLSEFSVENEKRVDFEKLEYVIRLAVRFLDDIHDISFTPVEYVNKMSKGLRRIGLGVMGWADLLVKLEIPYDSTSALELAEFLSWFISFFAWLESYELAQEKGPFPLYDSSRVNLHVVEKVFNSKFSNYKFDIDEMRRIGFRNVSVTSIAPTGTISLLCDVNSGIEPFFALFYRRYITEGIGNIEKDYIIEMNPLLLQYIENEENKNEIIEEIKRTGVIDDNQKIPEKIRRIFRTAHQISPENHIFMQAAWQSFISNSISKTINCPENITPEEISDLIILMWNNGLKGGTIYRDNSKSFQILNAGNS